MANDYKIYDSNGRYVGHASDGYSGADSSVTLGIILGFLGIIDVIVGIIFGIGPMLTFAFWTALIMGGFWLIGYLLMMGIFKLHDLFDKWTAGHAGLVWTIIMVIFVLIGVSSCHNWLVGLVS